MTQVPAGVPLELLKILNRPIVCADEDRAEYERLRDLIVEEIQPVTTSEYLLAYDIAAAEWELLRLHRFKGGMINVHVIRELGEYQFYSRKRDYNIIDEVRHQAREAFAGDRQSLADFEISLIRAGARIEELTARAFEKNIQAQTQIAHLIDAALRRREACYREIERRHQNRLKQTAAELAKPVRPLIDAEANQGRDQAGAAATIDASSAPSLAPSKAADDGA